MKRRILVAVQNPRTRTYDQEGLARSEGFDIIPRLGRTASRDTWWAGYRTSGGSLRILRVRREDEGRERL